MKYWIKIPKSDQIVETKALLDCGATHMFIDADYVEELGLRKRRLPRDIIVYNADGTWNKEGKITHYVALFFSLGGERMAARFYITSLKDRIVLGMTWLKMFDPIVRWKDGYLMFPPYEKKVYCDWAGRYRALRVAVEIRRRRKAQWLRQEIIRRLPILARAEKERRLRRARVEEVEDDPGPPLETLPYDSPYVMDYATNRAPVATIRMMSNKVKENLPIETVMDLWSRRIIYGEYAVTWEEMEREIEEGADLVWIRATFTPAQQLAEKEASGKKDKSLEEMVPPEYIGGRSFRTRGTIGLV